MLRRLPFVTLALTLSLAAACGGPEGLDASEDLASEEDAATSATNINTASAASLDRLPGVSRTLANAIVADRAARGPFWLKTDLKRVPGVTASIYSGVQSRITVGTSCQRVSGAACGTGTYCRVRREDAGSATATGICLPTDVPTGGSCVCSAEYRPVCGNDGKTYSNACGATCANVGYSEGACPSNPACYCRSNCAQTVCGSDHKTYSNAALAACAGAYVVSYGTCH